MGHQNLGSIVSKIGGSKFPTSRITSPPIEIKEGHLYHIEGFLKTELKLGPKEREGFLRIDFYGAGADQEKVGILSSVSSRVYDTEEWIKKEVMERAPE